MNTNALKDYAMKKGKVTQDDRWMREFNITFA